MFAERRLDALKTTFVSMRSKESFQGNKKSGLFTGRSFLCKEAKGKGKSLREGDARCSPDLRQDTRIEDVSILGRGLKSF
jgi:hypothetical protein